MEALLVRESQNSGSLSKELAHVTERMDQMDTVRAEQEGTIRVKQAETYEASQRIQVCVVWGGGGCLKNLTFSEVNFNLVLTHAYTYIGLALHGFSNPMDLTII